MRACSAHKYEYVTKSKCVHTHAYVSEHRGMDIFTPASRAIKRGPDTEKESVHGKKLHFKYMIKTILKV